MSTMTDKQAYAAMFHFLEQFFERSQSDDVAGLLGSMSLLADGGPADRAVIKDWQDAVQFALNGGEAGALVITPKR